MIIVVGLSEIEKESLRMAVQNILDVRMQLSDMDFYKTRDEWDEWRRIMATEIVYTIDRFLREEGLQGVGQA